VAGRHVLDDHEGHPDDRELPRQRLEGFEPAGGGADAYHRERQPRSAARGGLRLLGLAVGLASRRGCGFFVVAGGSHRSVSYFPQLSRGAHRIQGHSRAA
jgi:hypothetical protein